METTPVLVYVARERYKTTSESYPSFEVNDIIHVSAEYLQRQNISPEKPDGWIYGMNIRTGQEGFFHGEKILLII